MCRIKRIERHFTLIVVSVLFVLTFLEKRSQKEIIKTNVKLYNRTKQLYRAGNSSVSSVDNSTRNATSNKVNVTATPHRRVVNVTDKPLREERNNVFKYEKKFVPKDFACQEQEIIKGLVTQSRNLFMCSLKLEEFNQQITSEIESTDTAAVDNLKYGGFYKPRDSIPTELTAIIVPYRDRADHLEKFLAHLHPFLQEQHLQYGVYVVEMALPTQFNRGLLVNAGFLTARSINDYDCYIIHDVDLLPTNKNNLYKCGTQGPRHLVTLSTKYRDNRIPYPQFVGGVLAMTSGQFIAVNGFSNFYFGWGGEDDDMYKRITSAKLTLERPPEEIGAYVNLTHKHNGDSSNPRNPHKQMLLAQAATRQYQDGLNSIMFQRQSLEFRKKYTRVVIKVSESEIMADYPSLRANVDLGDKKIKSKAAKMIHSLNIPQKAVPADETRVKENQMPKPKNHPKPAPQKNMPRKLDAENLNLKQVPKLKPPQQAAPQRIMPRKVYIGNENVKQESKLQPGVQSVRNGGETT